MRPELEAQIRDACPILFRNGLQWGFECEDGWFAILENLSLRMESICRAWPEGEELPVAFQVKEKLGGLRFYLSQRTPDMGALIEDAQEACERTCEVCGTPGENIRINGWFRTLCPWCQRDAEQKASSRDIPS